MSNQMQEKSKEQPRVPILPINQVNQNSNQAQSSQESSCDKILRACWEQVNPPEARQGKTYESDSDRFVIALKQCQTVEELRKKFNETKNPPPKWKAALQKHLQPSAQPPQGNAPAQKQPQESWDDVHLQTDRRATIKIQGRDRILGPNGSQDEGDIKLISEALESLALSRVLDKRDARLCLINVISNECKENRDREILNQLLLQNPLALDLIAKESREKQKHPGDIQYNIYLSASDEVREMLAESHISANRAFPFVLPFKSKPQIVAWQMFSLKKEWRLGSLPSDIRNERIYKYRMPIVSFIKLGSKFRCSKSEIINGSLFPNANRVFCEVAFTHGMQARNKSVGMIDIAFAGPELIDTLEGNKIPDLPELLTVMNLHGDALDQRCETQLKFLRKISQLIVVIPESEEVLQKANFTINDPPILIVHNFEKHEFNFQNPNDNFSFFELRQMMCNDQFQTVRSKIASLINEYRPRKMEGRMEECWQSIEQICERDWIDMHVDFKYLFLSNAKQTAEDLFGDMTAFVKYTKIMEIRKVDEQQAKKILLEHHFGKQENEQVFTEFEGKCFMQPLRLKFANHLTQNKLEEIIKKFGDMKEITGQDVSLSGSRNCILRLQDKRLCQDFAKQYKLQNRETDLGEQAKILAECNSIREKIKTTIQEELQKSNNDYELSFVRRFIKILSVNLQGGSNSNINNRFLDYFGYLLESTNEEEMYQLRDQYSRLIANIRELEKQYVHSTDKNEEIQVLRQKELILSERINTESFGREHFFREIGLIYHFADQATRDRDELIQNYLKTVADLMQKGYAIELMDGDNSFIWIDWIKAILKHLGEAIKEFVNPDLDSAQRARTRDPKGISISIMGLQSSGKSTMLNCMFNSKFAVAAGRCTKGIYMLPVILDKEIRTKCGFDYVLIFDTEGLRAMELGMNDDNRVKDNEMATTSVSVADVTLVNSMRMQNTELYELLGVVATAILRYQKQDKDKKNAFRVSTIFCNQGIEPSQRSALEVGVRKREVYLNDMAKLAAEGLKHPKSYTENLTFASLMTQNIEEQFIPPLFSDSGNRKRFAFGYIKSTHSIRHCILDVNKGKAREMNNLIEKIDAVYKCIVVDDYTFSFKNNQEMEAINMAQKWLDDNKLSITEAIRKLLNEGQKQDTEQTEFQENQIDFEFSKHKAKVHQDSRRRYQDWFNIEKKNKPELGHQEDSFFEKLFAYIEEEFRKEKEIYLAKQEKRKGNQAIENEFFDWQQKIRDELLALNDKGQLPEFEEYFQREVKKFEEKYIEKNKLKQNGIQELYNKSFEDFFTINNRGGKTDLRKYLEAKKRGKQFTFKELNPLSLEITDKGEMNPADRKTEFEQQSHSRDLFRDALIGSYVLPGEAPKNEEVKPTGIIKIVKDAEPEQYDLKDDITFDVKFFTILFGKIQTEIVELDSGSFQMLQEEFCPWITETISSYLVKLHEDAVQERFRKRLEVFLDKLKDAKINVRNLYDDVRLGLDNAQKIVKYMDLEFDAFCNEAVKEVNIRNAGSLIQHKLCNLLESKVGAGKVFPATRRDALYYVMKEILEMSKLQGVEQWDMFDKIYKLYNTSSEQLISQLVEQRLRVLLDLMTQNADRSIKYTMGNTEAEIYFPKDANFLSVDLIQQYVSKWEKHISSLITDLRSKKDAKPLELEALVDEWVEKIDRSFAETIDFANYAFGQKVSLKQSLIDAVRSGAKNLITLMDDIIRALNSSKESLYEKVNKIADKLEPLDLRSEKERTAKEPRSKSQILPMVEKVLNEFMKGCDQVCPACGALCSFEAKGNHTHSSDIHSFPVIRGYVEDENGGYMANNTRICQNIVQNKQKIEGQDPVDYFAKKGWHVDPAKELYTKENTAAFGAWAIAKYESEFKNTFGNLRQSKWTDPKMFTADDQEMNYQNALKFVSSKVMDFKYE